MLNVGMRREAIAKLEKAVESHGDARQQVKDASTRLFAERKRAASEVIERVSSYVTRLASKPKEFDGAFEEFRVETSRFDETLRELEIEARRTDQKAGALSAGGTLAGVATAAFGPTAAMAIATTFGTASTGTAISALSGAAATNAALAWLGGGALAAGGGGMAAGNALLALAGPVGWTIGGVALAGTAVFLHRRNGRVAEQATKDRMQVEAEVRSLRSAAHEARGLAERTKEHADGCLSSVEWLENNAPANYAEFAPGQKERLTALVNNIRSLSQLLRAQVEL